MEQRKVIGNVNVLDLRTATEASIREIASIGNANFVLVTSETANLLRQLSIGNINLTHEAPANADVQLVMGPVEIGKDHFSSASGPLGLLVMGPLTVAPDATAEDLDRGLSVAMVMGPLTCPEHLAGVVQSKAPLVMGPIRAYPILAKMHTGMLKLDAAYLESLADRTELGVVGSVVVPEPLPTGLIERKLAKLHVTGAITCSESDASAFHAVLTGTSGPVREIPDGHKVIDREIELTRQLLESISDRKLYCARRVVISNDVDPTLFAAKVDSLVCKRGILYPQALQEAIGKVCDLLATQAIPYEGDLWLIDGETKLHPSRFDYLSGKATLVVDGDLTLEPDVRPETITTRIAKVHLTGIIRSTPEQRAALEALLGISDGIFEGLEEEPKDDARTANVNYLVL